MIQNEKSQKLNQNNDNNNNDNKKNENNNNVNEKTLEITVRGIDICDYIIEKVKGKKEDYIVLKMDIEGSEYQVLPFILENEACYNLIDRLVVEFHDYVKIPKKYDSKQLIDMLKKKGIEVILWD